jgi:hypothetical protein
MGVKVGLTVHVATGVKVAAGVQVIGSGVAVALTGAMTAAMADAGVGEAGDAQPPSSKASSMTIAVWRLMPPIVGVCPGSPRVFYSIVSQIWTKSKMCYDKWKA